MLARAKPVTELSRDEARARLCLQQVVMTECWHAGLSQACHGAERRRGTGQAVSAAGGDEARARLCLQQVVMTEMLACWPEPSLSRS